MWKLLSAGNPAIYFPVSKEKAIFVPRSFIPNLTAMKEIKLEIHVRSLNYGELNETDRRLTDAAREATSRSYSPYSHFAVGAAALLENGTIVTGSNQENAAYPSGTCAERTTVFYANSQYPDQPILTLAIAARNEAGFLEQPISPCGACRQMLYEFAPGLTLLVARGDHDFVKLTLGDLLPHGFGPKSLSGEVK